MIQQPHIYTLPEAFIKDPAVPTRWRVWAVINGFFISGKTCWASNEWIGERINAHKDSVSQAVKELEKMGFLTCKRTRRKRLISSPIVPEIGATAYLRSVLPPISDRHQRLSIALSNSDNNTGEGYPRIVIKEEKEIQKKSKKDTRYLEVFALWGKYPLNWRVNKTEIEAAKNILEEHSLLEAKNALKFFERFKGEEMCPQILKPSDLDRKWVNLQAFRDKI